MMARNGEVGENIDSCADFDIGSYPSRKI
jgi:hypothetical protein